MLVVMTIAISFEIKFSSNKNSRGISILAVMILTCSFPFLNNFTFNIQGLGHLFFLA